MLLAWPPGLGPRAAGGPRRSLVYQLALILPYTPLWPRQALTAAVPGDRSLRLVTVNVLMTNRRVDGLAPRCGAAPDLVLALETDPGGSSAAADAARHRHRVLHPLDNTYGIALFSRLELLEPEVRELLTPGIPSIRTRVRLPSGETVCSWACTPSRRARPRPRPRCRATPSWS